MLADVLVPYKAENEEITPDQIVMELGKDIIKADFNKLMEE